METVNETVETQVAEAILETPAVEAKEKRPHVPREKFLQIWEQTAADLKAGKISGSGITLVAEATGLKPNTVQQRATKYRATYGLPLSNMPRGGGPRFNVDSASAELEAIKAKIAADNASDDKANETETEDS